jgi:uncharacterized protein with LGFP repeats
VPEPPIVSRADWGADESMSPDPPEYNQDVKAVFVHHTDGTNDYSCSDSAAIVRAFSAYHVQTDDWEGIGCNFLADTVSCDNAGPPMTHRASSAPRRPDGRNEGQ